MGASTRLTCPHCNRKSSTAHELKEGTKVRCPGCHRVFDYVPQDVAFEFPEIGVMSPTDKGSFDLEVAKTESVSSPPQRVQRPPVPPVQAASVQVVHVNVPAPRKGNSIASAALVLGITAALICWVPFLGLLSIPAGLLGLLLGLIGLLLAVLGRRPGLASSLVGTTMSIGAIALSFAITGSVSKSISDSLEKKRNEDQKAARPLLENAPLAAASPTADPTKVVSPQNEPVKKND